MSAAGTAQSPDSSRRDGDLFGLPDRPLPTMPAEPVTPRFVVEHRSALHGKTITARGTVVRVIEPGDGRDAVGGGLSPRPGRFAQPRVVLAESQASDRDTRYDLVILLREGDGGFRVGDAVDVEGTVDGNQRAVVVRRRYREI